MTGRVGTLAAVRGEGFPGKNDEGDSFSVEIIYESASNGRTTVSAQPDASGKFETEIRIPTTAGIPSTNTVKAQFEYGDNNTEVPLLADHHNVPEGAIRAVHHQWRSRFLRSPSSGEGLQELCARSAASRLVPSR